MNVDEPISELKPDEVQKLRDEALVSRQGIVSLATTTLTPNTMMRKEERAERYRKNTTSAMQYIP